MASVAKRDWTHNGETKTAWVVRYTDQDGKRRLKTCKSKKEADKARLKIETEIEGGIHTAASETATVRMAAETWLAHCEHRVASRDRMTNATLAGYRRYTVKHIIPALGHRDIASVGITELQKWVDELLPHYSAETIRYPVVVMKQILSFSVSRGWVKRNVLKDHALRYPRMRKRIRVPAIADLEKLLALSTVRAYRERSHTPLQKQLMIALALFSGLRRGEIAGLHWQFVNFATDTIQIRHSLSRHDGLKDPKSIAGIRDVPMAPQVRYALRQLHDFMGQPDTGPIFISRFGKPLSPERLYEERFVRLMRQADLMGDDGKPLFRLHALRHAAVSLLAAEGLSPIHIASMIGHAYVSTTMNVYGHLFPEDQAIRLKVLGVGARLDATNPRQGLVIEH